MLGWEIPWDPTLTGDRSRMPSIRKFRSVVENSDICMHELCMDGTGEKQDVVREATEADPEIYLGGVKDINNCSTLNDASH